MKQSRLPQGMCFASQYLWQQLQLLLLGNIEFLL